MFSDEQADDYAPITVLGRIPIYLNEVIIGVHVASMVTLALWAASSGSGLGRTGADWFISYQPEAILGQLQIWRLATYSLQNTPSLWFIIGMFFLWSFGRQVERFYGRQNYLVSYLLLVLVPAVVGLLPGLRFPLAGANQVHFGVFLMFTATYPGAVLLFGILAKWAAWAFLAIYSLVYLGQRDVSGLVLLWTVALLAYGLTRYLGRGDWLPEWARLQVARWQRPQIKVLPSPPERSVVMDDPVSSINPILEKIARSGMASLTQKEKAALEAASVELQRKSRS